MKVEDGFHLHFSDDSTHNATTTFEDMKKIIHWMYETNLSIKDVIIYDTKDGFRKQYKCENTMWLLSVLSFI